MEAPLFPYGRPTTRLPDPLFPSNLWLTSPTPGPTSLFFSTAAAPLAAAVDLAASLSSPMAAALAAPPTGLFPPHLNRLRLLRRPPPPRLRRRRFMVISGVGGGEKGVSEEERAGVVVSGGRGSDPVRLGGGRVEEAAAAGSATREEAVAIDELGSSWPPWKGLPQRYKLIGATSLAFVICNMDKVNLSVAIIPMSHQFGWNSSMAGLVQSSFFWGYALSQLPGGWLAKIFGGRKVLEVGVLTWSLATMFVPLVAGFMPGLVLSRILVGIGEGVSPSAATDLIAGSVPLEERSRAVALVFGGLSIGSVLGLLLAPSLIQNFGWDSVFYLFGVLGVAWCWGFQSVEDGSSPFEGLRGWLQGEGNGSLPSNPTEESLSMHFQELGASLQEVPWRAFFKSPAVWAMICAHFCGSWGHYTCLSWLPTYFSEELNLNLTEAAWVSVLPPLASILVTSFAALFADNLISRGVETTVVRKICQTVGFLSPALCMAISSVDLGLPPWEIVIILTCGLGLSSFALSGLYCTHQDISPEYASILLGITNTVGALPGIIGVALTGFLLDSTHSWSVSLFAPSIFFYLTGTVVWITFASSRPQKFSKTE